MLSLSMMFIVNILNIFNLFILSLSSSLFALL